MEEKGFCNNVKEERNMQREKKECTEGQLPPNHREVIPIDKRKNITLNKEGNEGKRKKCALVPRFARIRGRDALRRKFQS